MEWKYVKNIENGVSIDAFEAQTGYKFPIAFVKCVLDNNGGRPSKRAFVTRKGIERVMKTLLSFNKTDRENIWDANDMLKQELGDRYIAFADDNFGNLICFDTGSDEIVFVELESLGLDVISEDFEEFMNQLND
ncbi:MAG: SMI1/KNR4 family protein [Eubacterium sp.]|nr:SMI1/KNR4 family protein [Eubacterium sp.]